MQVIIYSKPACVQCTATKRSMEAKGIEFTELDVTKDQNAYDAVVALGYRQMPVVTAGEVHWSGFDPDRISDLVA